MKKVVDFLAKAKLAWGADLPDWVEELAKEVNRKSQRLAGARIGYTGGLVSAVIARKYRGDMARVEAKVRGALMGATVECPVLGVIGRHRCLDEQKMPNTGASPQRGRLYRKCRGIGTDICPHSRHRTEADDAQS